MGRAPCCEKVGLKKGRWAAEEDEILIKYIQAHGEGCWRSLPKNAGLLRCGKSCRLRWINYLRADLKRGNISPDEEDVIIKLHASLGNRWSLIASHLPGRTDNEIKNYWNSHLSRRIQSFRRPTTDPLPMLADIAQPSPALKRKCGKSSRWAMKKNKIYPQTNPGNVSSKLAAQNGSVNGATKSPEKEGECVNNANKDVMGMHSVAEDKDRTGMSSTATYPNLFQVSNGGMSGSGEEREKEILCSGDLERTNEKSILYPTCNSEKQTENGGINGETWYFNGVMENGLVVSDGTNFTFSEGNKEDHVGEERESGGCVSSKGENGDLRSCSSINSCMDDRDWVDFDWEGIVQGHELWGDTEDLQSFLWDDDNAQAERHKSDVLDSEKQNALIAWLFS